MKDFKKFAGPIQCVLLFVMPAIFVALICAVLGFICAVMTPSSFSEVMYSVYMYSLETVLYFAFMFIMGHYMWESE